MELRLFIIAIIPAMICLSAIYLVDREDKEPLKILMLTYILGAITVLPAIFIEEFFLKFNVFSGSLSVAYNAFIYSVFASMGFATVENIIYVVFTYSNNAFIGLYRGIFSVPAHAIFGITMGYYLSLARFHKDKRKKRANYIKSLVVPVILHGIFNFILMTQIPELSMLFIPYVLYLWWANGKKLGMFVYDSKHKISHRRRE